MDGWINFGFLVVWLLGLLECFDFLIISIGWLFGQLSCLID